MHQARRTTQTMQEPEHNEMMLPYHYANQPTHSTGYREYLHLALQQIVDCGPFSTYEAPIAAGPGGALPMKR